MGKKKRKQARKERILSIWDELDAQDKSTEYILQYIQDVTDIDYDTVLEVIVEARFEKNEA